MQQPVLAKIRMYLARNRHNRVFRKFVQILCCLVVFVTTYALILPAITMEQKAFCGREEHTHDESCMQTSGERILTCSPEQLGLHSHSGACYSAEGALTCGQADYVVHHHADVCYDDLGRLVCPLPERDRHVHSEDCYVPGETLPEILHVHTEDCYIREKGELTCTQEEREGHTHSGVCYTAGDILECELTEHHVHGDSCYAPSLSCTISTEPHVHTESCFHSGDLLCTVPEGHVHSDGCMDRELSCGLSEGGHIHGDSCWAAVSICEETEEAHVHGDGCTATELVCGLTEDHHIHGDSCYSVSVHCGIAEDHRHDRSCYETVTVCGREAGQAHEHTPDCYGGEAQLQCLLTENHSHTAACYSQDLSCTTPEDPGHTHSDDCHLWNTVQNCGMEEGQPEPAEPVEPVLICTEPDAPVHNHGDACFEMTEAGQAPVCRSEEAGHEHSDACYGCDLEEHTHTLACYSDPEADVETAAIWEATLANVTLTGHWPTDLVAIAESQLGYTESTRNYTVWEDNSVHGYTRYGDWYGSPHGDWCAMFVSFCIRYANVEGMPLHWGVRPWIEELTGLGLYHSAESYSPKPGDLIFYDWEGDGLSDHVGIVAEVTEAAEHMGAGIKAIEGNSSNAVRYVYYTPDDPVILGYSELPAQEEPMAVTEKTAVIYTDSSCEIVAEEAMRITVTGAIPEEAVVRAYPVTPETGMALICAYDISVLLPDGTVFEPPEGETVTVCLRSSDFLQLRPEANVFYIPPEGSPVAEETTIAEGTVSFAASHFSVYAVAVPVPTVTKTALIYTDGSYETPAEDAAVITLSGMIPEDAEVRAYPTTVETGLDVLCAYDITIFLPDGSVFEPGAGEVVNVSIRSPVLEEAVSGLEVFHIPEEGEPAPVEAEVSEGTVSFDAEHFSVYAIARAAEFQISAVVSGVNTTIEYETRTYSKLNYETLCAYKINVTAHFDWGDQTPYWGGEPMTVTITSNVFAEKQQLVVCRVDDWGGVTELEFTHSDNTLQFVTTPGNCVQGYFAVLAPPESLGSMVLDQDLVISERIYIPDDVTIDLNGYTIRPADGYTDALFEVMEGGNLTILDSQAEQGSGHSLTYSVMSSSVSDASIGATMESTEEYGVSASGGIEAGAGPVIQVSGGTVTIESGMIHGGTGRAIVASDDSTVNLNGGYIYDFSGADEGGAIYINGGELNLSGTVVANNHADNYGGGVYASNCEVNMTGGVISGNTVASTEVDNGYSGSDAGSAHYGGGGIAVYSSTFDLSGGYVTCNTSLADGYWGGGGGILCRDWTTLNISGGYVTGNTANAGGGIKTIDYVDGSATVNISGGYICSNHATYGEGGGVSIGGGDNAYVTAGYINNNRTDSPYDWGGGGLFVANDASLYIEKALVTENSSGGFGGGIAGCSTARMHISITEGGAIYNNDAAGRNMAGGGSTKSEDVAYALNSPVFMQNGYQDIFSALNCTVEGGMLGGAAALWTGSCDGEPVNSTSANDLIHSETVLGLTANANADYAACSMATVFITGNYSNTHGGGILCNGYMVMGTPREAKMYVGARLEVAAGKQYLDQSGEPLKIPASSPFTFVVEKEDGTVVTTGTANQNGQIIFDGRIPFYEEGSYTYLIREVPGSDPTVLYDQTRYRLRVSTSIGRISNPASSVETYQCYIDSVAVDKWNPNSNVWESYIEGYDPADTDKGAIHLDLGDSFVNYGGNTDRETSLTVTKVWNCGDSFIPESITVALMQNDVAYSSESASAELNEANQWTHTWTELPVADEEGSAYTYTVQETALENFDVSYSVEVDPEDATLKATITNTLKTYSLDVSKVSNHSDPVPLEGAVFVLKDATGQVLSFVADPETGTYIPATGSEETEPVTELVTSTAGKLLLSGLPGGTYTLEETQAPFGFQLAAPETIHLGGTLMEVHRVHSLTVVDKLMEYELPETGGSGTYLYTTGGLLLMAAALVLLYYNVKKGRREDWIPS